MKIKSMLAFSLALTLLAGSSEPYTMITPVTSYAAAKTQSKSFTDENTNLKFTVFISDDYDGYDGYAILTGHNQTSEDLEIPASVTYDIDNDGIEEKFKVTTIGMKAFYTYNNLKSVIIPDSVKVINQEAFSNCSGLTQVSIGNSVESIEKSAFYSCSGLTDIKLGDSVNYIGINAFGYCLSLENISLPDSIKTIETNTFQSCKSLKSITIPDSVESIGRRAFSGCIKISSLSIPNSVINIEEKAFEKCTSLQTVSISNPDTILGEDIFSGCTNLDIDSFKVPDSLTAWKLNIFSCLYYSQNRQNSPSPDYKIHATTPDNYFEINNNKYESYQIIDTDNKIIIFNYNDNGEPISVRSIDAQDATDDYNALGIYTGEKYNFVFYARVCDEDEHGKDLPVGRIGKYDKDWNYIETGTINSGRFIKTLFQSFNIGADTPSKSGTIRCDEYNGKLYVHSHRALFKSDDPNGLSHQANVTFYMDEETMKVTLISAPLNSTNSSKDKNIYCGHSFDQYVRINENGTVYYLDLCDAYPERGVRLSTQEKKYSKVLPVAGKLDLTNMSKTNQTGVTLSGMELSDNNVIVVGKTVDYNSDVYQASDPDWATNMNNGHRFPFISVVPLSLNNTKTIFLQNRNHQESENKSNTSSNTIDLSVLNDGDNYSIPWLIKVNNNKFYIMIHNNTKGDMLIGEIDGEGNITNDFKSIGNSYSDPVYQPVLNDKNELVWQTRDDKRSQYKILKLDPESVFNGTFTEPQPVTTTTTSKATTTTTIKTTTTVAKATTTTAVKVTVTTTAKAPATTVPKTTTVKPVVTTTTVPVTTIPTSGKNPIYGDVTLDGSVGLSDALTILQYVANSTKYPLPEEATISGDVFNHGDGLTAMDALSIQKYDAKLITELPESYMN